MLDMSDEGLRKLQETLRSYTETADELAEAERRLELIRRLHSPEHMLFWGRKTDTLLCKGCAIGDDWPCDTRKIADGTLITLEET